MVLPVQLQRLDSVQDLVSKAKKVYDSVKNGQLNEKGCWLPLLHTTKDMDVLILCVYALW